MSGLGINGSPMPVHIRPDWLTVVSVSGCLSLLTLIRIPMRILYYFFAYYFTAIPGEYQASIGDFAACLQRRLPQPRQQLYRTAPAVPMPPHYDSAYCSGCLEHPPAGRASAASERPRRPCGWGRRGASAERRVAPALPGARRPAGAERIATAYALCV